MMQPSSCHSTDQTNQSANEDGGLPSYITEAAVIISSALVHEAEDKFTESVEAYRSAIGKLLGGVQSDPDLQRQASVKKRVAQYISKAEQLVEKELELRSRGAGKSVSSSHSIPHLHLFSNLAELRQYKVIDILDSKVILAQHTDSKQKVIFKVLHKSSAVYKKSKTSLLPINIKFMVNLLKYWETDDAVFLMLEYCAAGKLWDLVEPLVHQQLQEANYTESEHFDSVPTSNPSNVKMLKPSKSFIMMREKSVGESTDAECTDSELGDLNLVHSHNNTLLVISDQQIQHYSLDEDEVMAQEEASLPSQPMSGHFVSETDRTYNSILEKVCQMELSLKSRLQGVTAPEEAGGGPASLSHQNCDQVLSLAKDAPPDQHQTDSSNRSSQKNNCDNINNNPTNTEEEVKAKLETRRDKSLDDKDSVFYCDNRPLGTASPRDVGLPEEQVHTSKDKKLRKLSEMLPQLPDDSLPDSTGLPDRIIRLWAAELVRVITSLHYRDIIIKDLNPDNILLDDSGHIRLSYQCEWVSVERSLSQTAIKGRFIAPEVLTPLEVTRSADWWSFGAILLLLYTGQGPSSLLATGLDGTIPLCFPSFVKQDAVQFITALLQVNPERRLGASSTGQMDIRSHQYFCNLDWDRNTFLDK